VEKKRTQAVFLGSHFLLLVLIVFAWAQVSQAAGVVSGDSRIPDQARAGSVETDLQRQPVEARPSLPEFVIEEKEGDLKGAEGMKFNLEWIRFQGNKVISSEELIWLVDEFLDQPVEVKDLQKIADKVTNYYKSEGYILTRAYVPPQNIELQDGAGKITIKVHEGRLGRVVINGNKRYKKEMIRNVMKMLSEEGVISADTIERTLLLLMDYPGLRVRATFVPSVEPGYTNVVLDVTEEARVKFGADYNNFGSDYVAEHRLGVNFSLNNLSGIGDAFHLKEVFGPDGGGDVIDGGMFYGRAIYTIPVLYQGTRLGLAYSYLRYDMGQELAALEATGQSQQANIWLSHPIVRSRNLSWWMEAGFDYKKARNELFGTGGFTLYDDDLYIARLSTHVEIVDGWKGRNILNASVYQGLADDVIDSRLEGDSQFTKGEFKFSRFQYMADWMTLLLSGTGQVCVERLPSSEQIQIGGAGTVRGYKQSMYSGDSGFYGTAELRVTVWDKWGKWFSADRERTAFQLAAFFDIGKVWLADNYPGEISDAALSGAGLGVRFAFSPYIQCKIDWAKHIDNESSLSQNDADEKNNGIWYVQVSVPY
jgi:hemolysin activation/secretion protein